RSSTACRRTRPLPASTWATRKRRVRSRRCCLRSRPKPLLLQLRSIVALLKTERARVRLSRDPPTSGTWDMATISAGMVKDLREKTGAGMMDCKSALAETGGDVEAAVDWLRKKGISKAAKKAGRVAAEGLVGVAVRGNAGALVEVNSETDFVARNNTFKAFAKEAAALALDAGGDLDRLLAAKMASGASVQESLTNMIANIGENMSVRRVAVLDVEPGIVVPYVHNAAAPELGRIGVLVALRSPAAPETLAPIAKQLAMHIAFAAPQALTAEHLPAEVVARER